MACKVEFNGPSTNIANEDGRRLLCDRDVSCFLMRRETRTALGILERFVNLRFAGAGYWRVAANASISLDAEILFDLAYAW